MLFFIFCSFSRSCFFWRIEYVFMLKKTFWLECRAIIFSEIFAYTEKCLYNFPEISLSFRRNNEIILRIATMFRQDLACVFAGIFRFFPVLRKIGEKTRFCFPEKTIRMQPEFRIIRHFETNAKRKSLDTTCAYFPFFIYSPQQGKRI